LDRRLRDDLRKAGDFSRVHALPRSGADVPDDLDARLVVLPAEQPYSKEPGNAAEVAAKGILESRGSTPRLYRNTLVFLAADKVRLQDLDEGIRRFLAWESIVREKVALNLDPHQVRQAETQLQAADGAVKARLPETYQWLLVPEQIRPQAPVTWSAVRLSGNDALAARASKKLRSDESLLSSIGSTIVRKHMDDVPLWRGDHVSVKQLVQDFGQYLYLPRLVGPHVLAHGIRDGLVLVQWQSETFGYAESYDEAAKRYVALRGGVTVAVTPDDGGLLVKPDVAQRQLEAERPKPPVGPEPQPPLPPGRTPGRGSGDGADPPLPPPARIARRYHGTVSIDAARVNRDVGKITDEVISHLVGLIGAKVRIALEIEAEIPNGVPENVIRTVTENGRTLKFTSQGFEES
jgi:hypothetical protein